MPSDGSSDVFTMLISGLRSISTMVGSDSVSPELVSPSSETSSTVPPVGVVPVAVAVFETFPLSDADWVIE